MFISWICEGIKLYNTKQITAMTLFAIWCKPVTVLLVPIMIAYIL